MYACAAPFPTTAAMEETVLESVSSGLAGAVLHVGDRHRARDERAYGHQRRYDGMAVRAVPEPMRTDSMADLASLTKVFAVLPLMHQLVDDRTLRIDDPVARYLPALDVSDKRDIRLRDLMGHAAFPDGVAFHDPVRAGALFSQDRETTVRMLGQVPMDAPPGTRITYSDLNFMALGAVIEAVTGQPLDRAATAKIYAPMGLSRTGYRPLHNGFRASDCMATERCGNTRDGHVWFPNIRNHTLQGEVHDEKAFHAMGEVSGHAGLFSTTSDLGRLCRLMLNGGRHGDFKLCSPETVALFRETFNPDRSFALGWRLPTEATSHLFGKLLPQHREPGEVVAHTGWTGQCAVLDFASGRYLLLLTNKKHGPADPAGHLNTFLGDKTPAGRYGPVVEQFVEGVLLETGESSAPPPGARGER
ncbi:serine hydrolase [Mitsuaria sp. CC2]|uniref:serine hydrolase n=1 Tax=Mitsuaria sp. CC2 TaxID=3029186 RepID=UPI003B8DB408